MIIAVFKGMAVISRKFAAAHSFIGFFLPSACTGFCFDVLFFFVLKEGGV